MRRLADLAGQFRPVAAHVQDALIRANDPAVRLERARTKLVRKRDSATSSMGFWAVLSVVFIVFAVLTHFDHVTADVGAVIAALLAFQSFQRRRRHDAALRALPTPREPAAARPVLPARSSLAREPMERLGQSQAALHDVLDQLDARGSVPRDSVAQARRSEADAASALRAVAAQLQAVERARDHAPALDRGPLAEGVRKLRGQLDTGLDGYGALVAAAGRVLVETTAPLHDLTEASDQLAGLALALRDLPAEPR